MNQKKMKRKTFFCTGGVVSLPLKRIHMYSQITDIYSENLQTYLKSTIRKDKGNSFINAMRIWLFHFLFFFLSLADYVLLCIQHTYPLMLYINKRNPSCVNS